MTRLRLALGLLGTLVLGGAMLGPWMLEAQFGGGGSIAAFGVAFPQTGVPVGVKDAGGLMQPLTLNADGGVSVHLAQPAVVTPLTDVTVTNASTVVVAADTTRLGLVCVNTGSQNVRVGSASTAPTSTKGVQIRPGGTYVTSATDGINAISETATSSTFSCTKETTS